MQTKIHILTILFTVFWIARSEDHHNHADHNGRSFGIDLNEQNKSDENNTVTTVAKSFEDGDDILTLNLENFNETLSSHDLLLVEFCE